MVLQSKISLFFIVLSLLNSIFCAALSDKARSQGFVYLHEVDPSILSSVRYNSDENFVGTRVDGYEKPVIIMTQQAAQALKLVQQELQKDGYSLVVYDAYRPQRAVDHFIRWSKDVKDQLKKSHYYPRINKADVFDLGYAAKRSGHTRGSTVDLTIIKSGNKLHEVRPADRTLRDGFVIKFLDDGTVDMGSSFDLIDVASHPITDLIDEDCQKMRSYLRNVMEKHGFKISKLEWWHFTLKDEPYRADKDASYFNFPVN